MIFFTETGIEYLLYRTKILVRQLRGKRNVKTHIRIDSLLDIAGKLQREAVGGNAFCLQKISYARKRAV